MNHIQISPEVEIAVFADNWVLISKTPSKNRNEYVEEVQNINAQLYDYYLTFTLDEINEIKVKDDKPKTTL